jgi:hypothetical protein
MRRFLGFALLLCLVVPARAEDAALAPLVAKLAAVRAMPESQTGERGGSPALTEAKHLLRDWVEGELTPLGAAGDATALANALNDRLRAAGLECDTDTDPQGKRCMPGENGEPGDTFNGRGYIAGIQLIRPATPGYLVLETSVGILCGYDDSAYFYEWHDTAWRRILDSERDTYTEKEYRPQTLVDVLVSAGPPGKAPLILTTGISPWCSSNWQSLYYRLWRAQPGVVTPAPLLDREEGVYLGEDPPVKARLGTGEVLIEFRDRSVDADVHNRAVIRHFSIGADDRTERVAPFALNPRDMVDEWLVRPWGEAAGWVDPAARAELEAWHGKLHRDFVGGDFEDDNGRCQADPTLWQIGIALEDKDVEKPPLYFRLRWEPPYRFTLLSIAPDKQPDCDQADGLDDDATLFPAAASAGPP